VKWKRKFLSSTKDRNYVGVKYHVRTDWPEHLIGLHNFSGGYAGISKIEEGKYCFCYMVASEYLRAAANSLHDLEWSLLCMNPHLKSLMNSMDRVEGFPVTISQIGFEIKGVIENDMLMLGDAAGMITPLCGNGMSMAMHSGKMAAELLHLYLSGQMKKEEMFDSYRKQWHSAFNGRMKMGRKIQPFFGKPRITNAFVQLFRNFPFLAQPVIGRTHGRPF
jgi:flavin-dependent dehydrogenase